MPGKPRVPQPPVMLAASSLRLVKDLYPRHGVDGGHVRDLARGLHAGDTLPAVVVERGGLRLVDGFHRVQAWQSVYGADVQVPVELHDYASERELLEDAVRRNAIHGRKLNQYDKTLCALKLQAFGVSVQEISVTMHTTPARVEELLVRVAVVQDTGPPQVIPVKPIIRPNADGSPRHLTLEQARVARSSSGWRSSQTVRQLIRELEVDLLDYDNDRLVALLWRLYAVIEERVPPLAVERAS